MGDPPTSPAPFLRTGGGGHGCFACNLLPQFRPEQMASLRLVNSPAVPSCLE